MPSAEPPLEHCATAGSEQERAFFAVNVAFGSLGRVCMAVDGEFRVRYASELLDTMLGEGASVRLRGESLDSFLGPDIFGPAGALREALLAGEKREGWRAVLRMPSGAGRLMSVSAAPIRFDSHGVCDPQARYLVVLRPVDEAVSDATAPDATFGLVGGSAAMARLFRLIDTLQHSESTVLITGDSGTGKELMARMIHARSPRRNGPFVVVNAAALPGDLLESELFGHVRGAFTGAIRDRAGRFEVASHGTLFLDEVGDLPLHLQVKLLRVLQEHAYERVGESQPLQADARIIAATNKNLRGAVAEGLFREDLYYRLRVIPIEIPPLRERREDIEPIARLLLSRTGARTGRELRLSPEAIRLLLAYSWPGNVRELENALEFAATVCRGQTLLPEDLPQEIGDRREGMGSREPGSVAAHAHARASAGSHGAGMTEGPVEVDAGELARALQEHRWNRLRTAKALGVSRSTLWRRMRALGLARRDDLR